MEHSGAKSLAKVMQEVDEQLTCMLPKADISDAGLKARLTRAIEARDAAVERAVEALKEFGVDRDEILEVVDKHIIEIAKGVKKFLGKQRGLHSV